MPQNGIFHEGIAALAQAFSQNPNLRILNLNDKLVLNLIIYHILKTFTLLFPYFFYFTKAKCLYLHSLLYYELKKIVYCIKYFMQLQVLCLNRFKLNFILYLRCMQNFILLLVTISSRYTQYEHLFYGVDKRHFIKNINNATDNKSDCLQRCHLHWASILNKGCI